MGIIFIVLLIIAMVIFIISKIFSKNKKDIINKNESSINRAPASTLDFLSFNSADGINQQLGSIKLNEILESYSNNENTFDNTVEKLKKEGFQQDDVYSIIDNYLKNMETKNKILEKEVYKKKLEYYTSRIMKYSKKITINIDELMEKINLDEEELNIYLNKLQDMGFIKINKDEEKTFIYFVKKVK